MLFSKTRDPRGAAHLLPSRRSAMVENCAHVRLLRSEDPVKRGMLPGREPDGHSSRFTYADGWAAHCARPVQVRHCCPVATSTPAADPAGPCGFSSCSVCGPNPHDAYRIRRIGVKSLAGRGTRSWCAKPVGWTPQNLFRSGHGLPQRPGPRPSRSPALGRERLAHGFFSTVFQKHICR